MKQRVATRKTTRCHSSLRKVNHYQFDVPDKETAPTPNFPRRQKTEERRQKTPACEMLELSGSERTTQAIN
jgi:hypothetical protein